MSKQFNAGFEQAKKQHSEGRTIIDLALAAREMPVSQYANGFLTYVTDLQIAEARAKGTAQ